MDTYETLAQLTETLVRYKTVEGNRTAQNDCLRFIVEYIMKDTRGLHLSQYEDGGQRCVVITNKDTKQPELLLSGHVDVVEGDDEQFVPKRQDGRIYGRGTMDMKGGVAAIVQLFKDRAQGVDVPSMGLMLTTDEERGGRHGVGYALNTHGWRADMVLIPEGKDRRIFVIQERGVCWVKCIARGRSAHGAYPWKGENAYEILLEAYENIRRIFPEPSDSWVSTMNLAHMEGGRNATNQIPDYAQATLDIRYTEELGRNTEDVIRHLKQAAPNVEFEVIVEAPMLNVPEDDPYIRMLVSTAQEYLGASVPVGYNHGASDAAWFARYDIPAMVSGIVGKGHHSAKEYVEIQSILDYYRMMDMYISRIARAY